MFAMPDRPLQYSFGQACGLVEINAMKGILLIFKSERQYVHLEPTSLSPSY